MKYAFFKGCKIPNSLPEYEESTRFVLRELDVELIDMDFNCCGHQVKDRDYKTFIYSAVRNLAIAEQQNLTIMTPCKCCFGNLMHAHYHLKKNVNLKQEIDLLLQEDGLEWSGENKPEHLLSVLRHDIGLEKIESCVVRKMDDFTIAAHYGCHALRPEKVVQFDNPFAPSIFEDLISVTGAKTVDWSRRLECCGNPVLEKNRDLSVAIMKNKFEDAQHSGAINICTACSYCQIQFDQVRKEEKLSEKYPEAILFTQLLALSFGKE